MDKLGSTARSGRAAVSRDENAKCMRALHVVVANEASHSLMPFDSSLVDGGLFFVKTQVDGTRAACERARFCEPSAQDPQREEWSS